MCWRIAALFHAKKRRNAWLGGAGTSSRGPTDRGSASSQSRQTWRKRSSAKADSMCGARNVNLTDHRGQAASWSPGRRTD